MGSGSTSSWRLNEIIHETAKNRAWYAVKWIINVSCKHVRLSPGWSFRFTFRACLCGNKADLLHYILFVPPWSTPFRSKLSSAVFPEMENKLLNYEYKCHVSLLGVNKNDYFSWGRKYSALLASPSVRALLCSAWGSALAENCSECAPQQLQAQRGFSTSGSSSGSSSASDTDKCPPQRPYRKDAGGDSLSGYGHQDIALHGNLTLLHHCLAPGKDTLIPAEWESLDFKISSTRVQVLAPPFTTTSLRVGYLCSLSITLTIYNVGVRILTSEVILTPKWDVKHFCCSWHVVATITIFQASALLCLAHST